MSRKYIIVTPELKLTLDLLATNGYIGEFMAQLLAKVYDDEAVDPEDFVTPIENALRYWFNHLDQITREY